MQTILQRLSGLVHSSVKWPHTTFFLSILIMGILERRSCG